MTHKPGYSVPEILRMHAEGVTNRSIAECSSISPARVGQLIKESERRAQQAERSRAIRTQIRDAGDFSRKMPVENLLCALNVSSRAEGLLRREFVWDEIKEVSLLDLMDFLLPIVEQPASHRDLMPAYRVYKMGQITYAELIKAMYALDCGEAYAAEWAARKKRVKDYLLETGKFYPYILHGSGAALLEE
jgi:hypothetical protein